MRVFVVGAYAGWGFRGRRWPFARFYVSPAYLQVATSGRRKINMAVPRETVIAISVGRGIHGKRFKIADAAGALARIGIDAPFGGRRIIAELRRWGYVVNE